MKMFYRTLLLLPLTLLFSAGCIPEVEEAIGTAVFRVSIAGYTEEGGKTIALDLHSPNSGKSVSRSVPLDQENSASAYFTSLAPGTWDATVQLLNDDVQVGSYTFSFDVFADESTENRVEGTYSDGKLTFTVYTADSSSEPRISIEGYRGTLFEERRYWDGSKADPEQYAQISAWGDLKKLQSCTVIFPDSYRFSIGPDSGRHIAFTFEQWENSTGENGFFLDRYNYFSTGSYFCSVYDENNLGDSFTYTFTIDEGAVSSPVITNPLEGQTYDSANDISIEWVFDNGYEIASTLIFVVEDANPANLQFSQLIEGAGSNSTTIPAATLFGATGYRLLLFAVEQPIAAPSPGSPNNELWGFTGTGGEYNFNDIRNALYLSEDATLEFIGSARLNFSTL